MKLETAQKALITIMSLLKDYLKTKQNDGFMPEAPRFVRITPKNQAEMEAQIGVLLSFKVGLDAILIHCPSVADTPRKVRDENRFARLPLTRENYDLFFTASQCLTDVKKLLGEETIQQKQDELASIRFKINRTSSVSSSEGSLKRVATETTISSFTDSEPSLSPVSPAVSISTQTDIETQSQSSTSATRSAMLIQGALQRLQERGMRPLIFTKPSEELHSTSELPAEKAAHLKKLLTEFKKLNLENCHTTFLQTRWPTLLPTGNNIHDWTLQLQKELEKISTPDPSSNYTNAESIRIDVISILRYIKIVEDNFKQARELLNNFEATLNSVPLNERDAAWKNYQYHLALAKNSFNKQWNNHSSKSWSAIFSDSATSQTTSKTFYQCIEDLNSAIQKIMQDAVTNTRQNLETQSASLLSTSHRTSLITSSTNAALKEGFGSVLKQLSEKGLKKVAAIETTPDKLHDSPFMPLIFPSTNLSSSNIIMRKREIFDAEKRASELTALSTVKIAAPLSHTLQPSIALSSSMMLSETCLRLTASSAGAPAQEKRLFHSTDLSQGNRLEIGMRFSKDTLTKGVEKYSTPDEKKAQALGVLDAASQWLIKAGENFFSPGNKIEITGPIHNELTYLREAFISLGIDRTAIAEVCTNPRNKPSLPEGRFLSDLGDNAEEIIQKTKEYIETAWQAQQEEDQRQMATIK